MWRYILCVYAFLIVIEGVFSQSSSQCEEPPNVAVIVVASVFTTLAVVLIICGIIFFCCWKRKRDSLKPTTPAKRTILVEDHDLSSPDGGVTNPAFNNSDVPADISLAEEGVSGYIQCQEYSSPGKSKSPKSSSVPWSSLPSSDLPPGIQRNGSVGSFDDTFFGMEPEVTSVWLQSQDFIGLGFNIAGSMRDGIFVSQVHNRGPAVESKQFKVGDRILSVTISFENMVYEDALTILSYASPYPVRVTLQKEKYGRKDRRVSETPSTLSHPLFRSQSMDTLKKIRKDSTVMPQRSFSEMRQEKKKDKQKPSTSSAINSKGDAFPTIQENGSKSVSRTVSENEVFTKEMTVTVEKEPKPVGLPSVQVEMVDENQYKADDTDAKQFAAQLFDKLNEQDKLDMLRLSYEDPSDNLNNSKVVISSTETSFTENPADIDSTVVEPRLPPVKPERRKKKSSSSGSSSVSSYDMASSPRGKSHPDALTDEQIKSEISEEIITPAINDRSVTLNSDKIEFNDVDISVNNDTITSLPDIGSRTLVDYSLSDMDSTFSTLRPVSPDNVPTIEEEVITPQHAKRDQHLPSYQDSPMDGTKNTSSNSNIQDETLTKASSSSSLSSSDDDKSLSKLQNTSSVDFNVTSSNPSLFSTPYPSRNTKETPSGVSYNISMNELNDIETQMSKKSKQPPKAAGGIAFEVRDDFTSGTLRNVPVESKSTSVIRTMSCYDGISMEQHERIMQMTRTGSFTGSNKKELDVSLDWSGKRLVRSGSFSDIPQDDSVNDWRDHNRIDDSDTINSESSLHDDIVSSNDSINEVEQKGLKKSNFFRARENLANLSDYSESLHSLTESSSQSSSPPPYIANGKDNGLGSSPESVKTPTAVIYDTDSDNNIIASTKIENKENIRVSMTTAQDEDDTDC